MMLKKRSGNPSGWAWQLWFEICSGYAMPQELRDIWTIGHSTRSLEDFTGLLHAHNIKLLVDIRSFPGSRRYPHFNKESLAASLAEEGIVYKHMVALGGRRKPLQDSVNTAWRHSAFRGYADYMQTAQFQNEIMALEDSALEVRTAYMCSEAPWWKCHRALVSDYLKVRGWRVWHIMDYARATEHPFTSPARVEQGQLFYGEH